MYNSSPEPQQPSRTTDSWIEISSRPSNSSLASAAPDEIVTAGLHVQNDPTDRARRRHSQRSPLYLNIDHDGPASVNGGGSSSQDEYEESESESDRVMTSSNEGLPHRASSATSESPAGELEGDANPTSFSTLAADQQCFTPQPNAFTHPPSSSSRHRASVPDSYFPAPRAAPSTQRHSFPGDRRPAHSPYSAISPGHQADHDAALRASLNTLLSCAAAARSLPKAVTRAQHTPPARIDTTTLRMVPESVALRSVPAPQTDHPHEASQAQPQRQRRLSDSSRASNSVRELSPDSLQQDKNKRKAGNSASNASANATDGTSVRSNSKDHRLAKKPRRQVSSSLGGSGAVDPTLLTWVVSAGVLVLVSAISFSAGYVTGREAGMAEASAAGGAGGALREGASRSCSREVGRGLRRLRWGVTGGAAGSARA